MAFGAFPATGTPGLIPLEMAAANTATAMPTAAAAAASNQAALGLSGWESNINLARQVNAFSALLHATAGIGLPLGLLPANLPLFNAFHAASDLNSLSAFVAAQSLLGVTGRTAALGRLAVTNLLLSPLSTGFA